MLRYHLYRDWYLPSNGTIYFVTLIFIWSSNIFLVCIYLKIFARSANIPGRYSSTRTAYRGVALVSMCIPTTCMQSMLVESFLNMFILNYYIPIFQRIPTMTLAFQIAKTRLWLSFFAFDLYHVSCLILMRFGRHLILSTFKVAQFISKLIWFLHQHKVWAWSALVCHLCVALDIESFVGLYLFS